MRKYISIYLLFGAAVLLMAACTPEVLDDNGQQNLPSLRPGERLVNLSLGGLAGNGAVDTRTGNAPASRAANENLTLAGECDIENLLIACFVNKDAGGNPVTELGSYTPERLYHYKKQGDANDFLLLSDADGYHAGIGVPQDDNHKRAFLLFANPMGETLDVTTMATYSAAFALAVQPGISSGLTRASDGLHLRISCPLPMGALATHRVISSDGTITDNPVFTQADLERGLSARMIRRVSRLDIANPDITGFKVEGIQVEAPSSVPYFEEATETMLSTDDYVLIPLTDAEEIPGACYLFPAAPGTPGTPGTKVKITLYGILMGAIGQTLKAEAVMEPNTRYILRVRNDESNVRVEIEVAPWDTGDDIPTEDVSGKLNTAANLEIPAESSLIATGDRSIYQNINQGNAYLYISGASGDMNPVGVLLDKFWGQIEEVTRDDGGNPLDHYELKLTFYDERVQRPETTTLTLVHRPKDVGGNPLPVVYTEYIVTRDYLDCSTTPPAAMAKVVLDEYFAPLGSIDEAGQTIHLPSAAGAAFRIEGYEVVAEGVRAGRGDAYLAEDYVWIEKLSSGNFRSRGIDGSSSTLKFTTLSANLSGSPREGKVVVRTRAGDTPVDKMYPIVETPWRIVQESGYNGSQLSDAVTVTLRVEPAGDLSMHGQVIERSGVVVDAWIYERYMTALKGGDQAEIDQETDNVINNMENQFAIPSIRLFPTGNLPVLVTAEVDWLPVKYEYKDGVRYAAIEPHPYLPTSGNVGSMPMREGQFTVTYRGGKTEVYTVRQKEAIKGTTDNS